MAGFKNAEASGAQKDMLRVTAILLGLMASAHSPDALEWHSLPLPSGYQIIKKVDGFGPGISVLVSGGESVTFSDVFAFYDQALSSDWERCPVTDAEWLTANDISVPAFNATWTNPQTRELLAVSSAEKMHDELLGEHNVDQFVIIHHHSDSVTWELLHRGFCVPRNTELFSPAAVRYSMAQCRSKSMRRFDSQAWRSADTVERGLMINDLICRGVLLGMREQEVLDLLGPPDTRRGTSFAYKAHLTDPPYIPMVEGASDCQPSAGMLVFDFDTQIPDQGDATFGLDFACSEAASD